MEKWPQLCFFLLLAHQVPGQSEHVSVVLENVLLLYLFIAPLSCYACTFSFV